MKDIKSKIAAGLERAFAERGFAQPSVEDLREAAGVSLRTLYKYMPSRDEMVCAALEHRHRRYVDEIFESLPDDPEETLPTLMDRIGHWMARETSHGCLFHAAVAAAPHDERLQELLQRHKSEVARRASKVTGLPGRDVELMLIIDGLTQSWSLNRQDAVNSAKLLSAALRHMSRSRS